MAPLTPGVEVLVTGALGFVGINIVRALARRGHRVAALTRRDPDEAALAFLGESGAQVRWHHGDVGERGEMIALLQRLQPQRVLHAAAITATPEQERADPTRIFDINAGGTLNLLEAARRSGAARFVLVGSTAVYGAAPPLPKRREEDGLQIGGLYTIAKQTSEELCRRYAELFGLTVAVGRLGTAYGPMERPTGSRSGMSSIQRAARKALAGEEIRVYGAAAARDFCYIEDVAEAFVVLLESATLRHHLYNVAGAEAAPLRRALEAIAEAVPGFSWREVDDPEAADLALLPGRERAGLDLGRLERDGPWRPGHDLHSGIRAYLGWLRAEAAAGRPHTA